MLIGIPPILGPELLATLRAMGHGDEIAIVDGNYPALEHARRLVRADGHGVMPILDAILQVMPIDDFVEQAIFRASVKGDPKLRDPVHDEIEAVCRARVPDRAVIALSGNEFYPRVRSAHTVVATSDPRLYANVILRKGVIYPHPR